MKAVLEGDLNGKGLRVAIISARFNEVVVDSLTRGAVNTLERLGVNSTDIDLFKVPGAFEITGLATQVVNSNKYQAVICLGAVIRGDTPHFDMVVNSVTGGLANLAALAPIPVVFGVLTTDTVDQAMDRSGLKAGNKGSEAAMVAVEMSSLYHKVKSL